MTLRPFFGNGLGLFASILIRNRATLGGNLVTASPIGDSAPLLLALDAEVRITGLSGDRMLPLDEFSSRTGILRSNPVNCCGPSSYRTVPAVTPVSTRWPSGGWTDISTVAAGIAVERDASGRMSRVRLAFGGVAATPLRAMEAEEALEGTEFAASDIERAREALRRALRPIDDHRGSAAYRDCDGAEPDRKIPV